MLEFNFHSAINEIGEKQWNGLCPIDYPFLRYEFLNSLEQSGCVTAETGWQPCHLQITEDNQTLALMPLYLKKHSYGEYVFDWSWADAYQRNGIDYYPKLITAIPFSPCYGPRQIFAAHLDESEQLSLTRESLAAIKQLASEYKASGWHGLFLQGQLLEKHNFSELNYRLGTQYHWFNHNFSCFDNFLDTFNSRKRKNLRKERNKIVEQNIQHRFISGSDLTDGLLGYFYQFYQITYLKRGRQGYLNQAFFRLLRETLAEKLHICFAFDLNYSAEEPVAAAMFLQDNTTLYGRYWGAQADYDSLHFETCYYQGIEFCIRHRLQRFDPGAQGEHKIQRGFEPIETWSAHWLAHPAFHEAVQRFTEEEEPLLRKDMEFLQQRLPFKKT